MMDVLLLNIILWVKLKIISDSGRL